MMRRLKLSVHFRTLKALVKYCGSLGDFKISFGFARKKLFCQSVWKQTYGKGKKFQEKL
jgi:hypothetical protein